MEGHGRSVMVSGMVGRLVGRVSRSYYIRYVRLSFCINEISWKVMECHGWSAMVSSGQQWSVMVSKGHLRLSRVTISTRWMDGQMDRQTDRPTNRYGQG